MKAVRKILLAVLIAATALLCVSCSGSGKEAAAPEATKEPDTSFTFAGCTIKLGNWVRIPENDSGGRKCYALQLLFKGEKMPIVFNGNSVSNMTPAVVAAVSLDGSRIDPDSYTMGKNKDNSVYGVLLSYEYMISGDVLPQTATLVNASNTNEKMELELNNIPVVTQAPAESDADS